MLMTTGIDPSTANLIPIDKNSIINEVDGIKVNTAKIYTKTTKSKSKKKSKNLMKFVLAKSQSST